MTLMGRSITVIDDLYSEEECKELIQYFQDRAHEARVSTQPSVSFLPIVRHTDNQPVDEFAATKVAKIFQVLDHNVRVQRSHVEMRNDGVGMHWHTDTANIATVFTSVTYLNDDYIGGNTIIRPVGEITDRYDTAVVPKIGRTVFFNGTAHLHCVTTASGNSRFTMPIWYRLLPGDFPEKHKWWL